MVPENMIEESWSKLHELANQMHQMAEHIWETYSALIAEPQAGDTPTAIVSKRVFDESEKNGEHRELIMKFQKQTRDLIEFAQTSSRTRNNTIRFMLLLVDVRETQEELKKSAQKHLAMIDDGVAAMSAW